MKRWKDEKLGDRGGRDDGAKFGGEDCCEDGSKFFKLFYGFCFMADRHTDRRMDIDGDSGVAFTTESLEKAQWKYQ